MPCYGFKRLSDKEVRLGITFLGWRPDLADPATLGCLLALVREAWGDDLHIEVCLGGAVTVAEADGSIVWSVDMSTPGGDPDVELAEALAAALLAAPPKGGE
jgi:hypothetical protein